MAYDPVANGKAALALAQAAQALHLANQAGAAAALSVVSGPSLLIKPGTGTWPSEADVQFAGRRSFYTRFDGLTRAKSSFAALTDFVRPTSATWHDAGGVIQSAAAGVPRLGFRLSAATWVLAGLLVEAQATNLLTFSQALGNNAAWGSSSGAVTFTDNTAAAPDGTATATRCTANGTGAIGRFQNFAVTPGATITMSVHVRLETLAAGEFKYGIFNNTTGAFIIDSALYAQVPNASGYTRCTVSIVVPAGCTSLRFYPWRNGLQTVAGSVLLWGAQAEMGSIATSYIPTASALATRAGDVMTKALGIEHNPNAGSIFARVFRPVAPPAASAARIVQLDDGTEANRLTIRAANGKLVFESVVAGVVTGTAAGPDWSAATVYAVVATYDRTSGTLVLTVNGVDHAAAATAFPAGLTTRRLGCDSAGGNQLNGFLLPCLEHSANGLLTGSYYPRALAPAERSAFA